MKLWKTVLNYLTDSLLLWYYLDFLVNTLNYDLMFCEEFNIRKTEAL